MAGRGRGGAAGRGRGRGSMSFSVEQLGFSAGEALPGPVLQPPPIYPLMENRPAPLDSAPEVEYWLALKREYIEFLHDSPAYPLPVAAKADIERYSDRYQALVSQSPKGYNYIKFDMKRLPLELRPVAKTRTKTKQKRKAATMKTTPPKVPKNAEDVDNRLKELEKNEQQEDEEGETENDKEDEKVEEDEGEDEEEVDEEMDEGTDYANNYFDNGESYIDDEDDNLDDGPVY